ncbi:hypothetical protein CVT26_011804 [Gymnopilus dilepis]|uniref:F-box domain-containing protein n=1 Tax=Gymnopilus dilepis TaxID=231916 RepID=A0A409WC75_9AGAR|nr:hypothetical protein CVT26_011804 [Gymnopilus dilepis]
MSSSDFTVGMLPLVLSPTPTDALVRIPEITLDKQPLDLHIFILAHLRSKDIITFRQVCRSFRRATQFKCVWTVPLRRIMAAHSLSETVHLSKKLNAEGLERLSQLQGRLVDLIERSNGKFIEPHQIRILPARLTQADEDRFQIQSSHQGYVPRVWWTPPHDAVVEPIRVP